MPNTTSQHILNTSANLLGFCLFVITSLHFTDKAEGSIIDELTSVVAILLIISCLFLFFQFALQTMLLKNDLKQLQTIYSSYHFWVFSL
jgi:uncharacterized membrane protein